MKDTKKLSNIISFIESISQIQYLYDNYLYHHVCKAVMNFLANTVSPIYCHLTKDRLYCDEALSPTRLAAVEVIRETLTVLARSVAPIVPHLAEEVWLHHPQNLGERSNKQNRFLQCVIVPRLQRQCRCITLNIKCRKVGVNRKSLNTSKQL